MKDSSDRLIFGTVGFGLGLIAALVIAAILAPSVFEASTPGNLSLSQAATPLPQNTYTATITIVAVQQQNNEGVTNTATVELQPGKGRVLVALNPFIEPDTQESAEIAAGVAARLTGKDLTNFDLIYSIDSPATLVGGPSAGAALTVATMAAIEQKTVRSDTAITGTVQRDGTIGPIGGVLEKAQAVSQSGKKLFLIPKGQGRLVYYESRTTVEQRGPIIIQRRQFVAKELDLIEYAQNELNLEVREVNTIAEAAQILLA